ncbi:protein TILLER ANGLE CONTROL 1-like isoform X2 [Telopea speciosissima]|uniref:protein TILLER ANGLE CONTROL 1-like isoform X2 n=1 Tax=Telopea speciosissima TaxID=54955 RepID=UPI001CC62FA9|nr:protein TILLER ANGLE CONTROL 1-like isoform X2 [Telopea speciosissima]
MKIFNWVHRKFHFNVDSHSSFSHIKDGVEQNANKFENVTSESDTDALLDHGLLSIGTFGFDPLELYNHLNGHFVKHIEDDDNDDEADEEEGEGEGKEELNPLVVKVFKGELDKALRSSSASAMKTDLSSTVDDEMDTPLLRFLESAELQIDLENSTWEEKKNNNNKGERTTLADLFSAEKVTTAAATGNSDSSIVHQPGRLEKKSCRKKHGLSFVKKFLSRKGENDSLPITNLHRLIKKMLKKKIHPELQGKVHKMNGPINPHKSEKGEGDAALNESLSMLQEREGMASDRKIYQFEDVANHSHHKDCWLIIHGKVYDVTSFMDDHPGGSEVLLSSTGKDATNDFEDTGHSDDARELMGKYCIGDINASTIPQKRLYVPPKQAPYNPDKTPEFVIKVLQFLVPLLILGLAFAVRHFTKKD